VAKLTSIRSVLAVKNLAASAAFYRDKLGFDVDFEADGWCFISRDSFRLMLGHCPDVMPAAELGDHSYFAFVGVEGIDDLHREFLSRGLTPNEEPRDKPWGIREFGITTPDGHTIMFGQPLERSE
jgi:catechol 2,3-dioxygenase-like lactoylglutathione lyase family enzyme